ncbi:hypothetical protein J5X84_37920 [Streptosporangiaceae bacterium NEAU-GS5]|nr:hypothetical protein [Streptosporangiaceae bacterium NEAU-GS5]
MTSVAIVIAAVVAAVLPLAPAQATYGSDQPVSVNVIANDGSGQELAALTGTLAFDDGNTKYRYNLQLCWKNAYPAPYFRIIVNGTAVNYPVQTGYSSATGCQAVYVFNSETNFGSTVRNIRFDVTAGWFNFQNQYFTRTKSSGTYDNPYN